MASSAEAKGSSQTSLPGFRAALENLERALTCQCCGNVSKKIQLHRNCGNAICQCCTSRVKACPCCHLDLVQENIVELQEILKRNREREGSLSGSDVADSSCSFVGDPYLVWATVEAIVGRVEQGEYRGVDPTTPRVLSNQDDTMGFTNGGLVRRNSIGGMAYYGGDQSGQPATTGRIGRLRFAKRKRQYDPDESSKAQATEPDDSIFDFHSQTTIPNSQDIVPPVSLQGQNAKAQLSTSNTGIELNTSPGGGIQERDDLCAEISTGPRAVEHEMISEVSSSATASRASLGQPQQNEPDKLAHPIDQSSTKTPHHWKAIDTTPSTLHFVTPASSLTDRARTADDQALRDCAPESSIASQNLPSTEQFDLLLKVPARATPFRDLTESQTSIASYMLPNTEQYDSLLGVAGHHANPQLKRQKPHKASFNQNDIQTSRRSTKLRGGDRDHPSDGLKNDDRRTDSAQQASSQSRLDSQNTSSSADTSRCGSKATEESIESQLLPSSCDYETLLCSQCGPKQSPSEQSTLSVSRQALPNTCDFASLRPLSDHMEMYPSKHDPAASSMTTKGVSDGADCPPMSMTGRFRTPLVRVLYDESVPDQVFDCLERMQLGGICISVKYPFESSPTRAVDARALVHATHYVPCVVSRAHPFLSRRQDVLICLRTFSYLCALAMKLCVASPEWLSSYERSPKEPMEEESPVWGDEFLYESVAVVKGNICKRHCWLKDTPWWDHKDGPATRRYPPSLSSYKIFVVPGMPGGDEAIPTRLDFKGPRQSRQSVRPLVLNQEKISLLCKLLGANVLSDISELALPELQAGLTLVLVPDGTPSSKVATLIDSALPGSKSRLSDLPILRGSWLVDSISACSLAPTHLYQFDLQE